MIGVILCYLAGLMISAAGAAGLYLFIKRRLSFKPRWGMISLGVIMAVVYFIAVMLLFRVTFTTEYYYNTPFFRGMVGLVFLLLLCLLRYLLVKGIFFGRYKEEQGFSFCLGFGAAPVAFLAIYLLIMLLIVGGNGIFNGPGILEKEGYLSFADNTVISVFQPVAGHISFAVLFFAIAAMILASAVMLYRISTQKHSIAVTVGWFAMMALLEAIAILPIPFISMFGLSHWQVALIAGVASVLSVVLLLLMPKEKKPAHYAKQFE